MFVGFAITSYVIKRASRVWAIRISAIGKVIAVILVIFLQDYTVEYFWLFGIIFGLAEGMYWGAILTLTAQTFSGSKMVGFVIWEQVARAIASILMPFTLGAVIEWVAFGVAAIISFGLGVGLLICTLVMKEETSRNCKPLSMRNYLRAMKEQGHSKAVWNHFWLQALHDTYRRLVVIKVILLMVAVGTNIGLGIFGSVFAAANILIILVYKWLGPKTKKGAAMYWLSAFLPFSLALYILFDVNLTSVILLHVGNSVIGSIVRAEVDKLRFNLTTYLGDKSWHTESILFTEIAFMLSRLLIPLIIIVAYFSDAFFIIQVITVTMMALYMVVGVMNKRWHKKFRGSQKKTLP